MIDNGRPLGSCPTRERRYTLCPMKSFMQGTRKSGRKRRPRYDQVESLSEWGLCHFLLRSPPAGVGAHFSLPRRRKGDAVDEAGTV